MAAMLLNAGCLGVDTRSLFSSKPETPPPATHMEVMWYKQVRYIPDPTKGGAMAAAVAGRMYLFKGEQLGAPVAGDGNVTVEIYDDSKPDGRAGTKPTETTTFPKAVLAKLLQKDLLGGDGGYTLLIPYPPDLTQVHITVRFEQTHGGTPLFTSSASMSLERGAQPSDAAGPTGQPGAVGGN
jgi:hypothetical protein